MTMFEMGATLGTLILILILLILALWSASKYKKQPYDPTPEEYQHVDEAIDNEAIELTGYLKETVSIEIIPKLTSNRPTD